MKKLMKASTYLITILHHCIVVCQAQNSYIINDVCPGEYCSYGKWKAKEVITVYSAEGKKDSAFSISKGEIFSAKKGNVHVIKPGIVNVTVDSVVVGEENLVFRKGDKIKALCHTGEGWFWVIYKGKKFHVSLNDFLGPPLLYRSAKDKAKGSMTLPVNEWWVLIVTKNKNQGWICVDEVRKKIDFLSFKK